MLSRQTQCNRHGTKFHVTPTAHAPLPFILGHIQARIPHCCLGYRLNASQGLELGVATQEAQSVSIGWYLSQKMQAAFSANFPRAGLP